MYYQVKADKKISRLQDIKDNVTYFKCQVMDEYY